MRRKRKSSGIIQIYLLLVLLIQLSYAILYDKVTMVKKMANTLEVIRSHRKSDNRFITGVQLEQAGHSFQTTGPEGCGDELTEECGLNFAFIHSRTGSPDASNHQEFEIPDWFLKEYLNDPDTFRKVHPEFF